MNKIIVLLCLFVGFSSNAMQSQAVQDVRETLEEPTILHALLLLGVGKDVMLTTRNVQHIVLSGQKSETDSDSDADFESSKFTNNQPFKEQVYSVLINQLRCPFACEHNKGPLSHFHSLASHLNYYHSTEEVIEQIGASAWLRLFYKP